ncbi:MAG: hypothetical protein ABWW69_03015 [Pyrodictiaceae archaeon]
MIPLSGELREQLWKGVLWVRGDAYTRIKSDERIYRVISGVARLLEPGRPLVLVAGLPSFPRDVYRSYIDRGIASIELAYPKLIEETIMVRRCMRTIDVYEVLVKAVREGIEYVASTLATSCKAVKEIIAVGLAVAIAGVLHAVREMVSDTIRGGGGRCAICGSHPVLLVRRSKDYEAICGWCGYRWRASSPCPECNNCIIEELEEVEPGLKKAKCKPSGHEFILAEDGAEGDEALRRAFEYNLVLKGVLGHESR